MCPKVSCITSKAFDRVLGGVFISLAGGVGCYSINAWLNNVHFNMPNVSQYTFSGRTSCMMRDCGGYERRAVDKKSPIAACLSNIAIATIAEEQLSNDHNDCYPEGMKFQNESPIEDAAEDTCVGVDEDEGEEARGEGNKQASPCSPPLQNTMHLVDRVRLQRQTSPSIFDILPCIMNTDIINTDMKTDMKTDIEFDASSCSSSLASDLPPLHQCSTASSPAVTCTPEPDLVAEEVFAVDHVIRLHQRLKQYLHRYLS